MSATLPTDTSPSDLPPNDLSLSQQLSKQIDAALLRYTKFNDDCPSRLQEAISYSLLAPGKRLRPQLVLLSARACGGREEDAMSAAVAVEMIHAYSLVHDDLPAMDDDDLRRGRATCHKQFDEATAILVGDALQARAFEILAVEIRSPACAAKCCGELASAAGAESLVGGQAADLAAESNEISLTELEAIHRRKTGALFRVAMRLGALVADASPQEIQRLGDFGRDLGLAFQIVDDLLDVSEAGVAGAEQRVGKRLGKDRQHGKSTYPELLGVEKSRGQVEILIAEACRAIEPFGEAADPLRKLAEFVGQRDR